MEMDFLSSTRGDDRNARERRARSFENLVSLGALSAFPQEWGGEEANKRKQNELEAEIEEEVLPVSGSHRGPSAVLGAPFRVSKVYRNVEDRLDAVVRQTLKDAADSAAPDERTDRLRELRELLEMPLSDTLRQSLQDAEGGPLRIPTRYFRLLAEMHARVALTSPQMLDLDEVLPGRSTLWSHPEFPCVFFLLFHLAFVGGFHDLELEDEKDTGTIVAEEEEEDSASPRRSPVGRGERSLHTRPNFELLLLGADQAFFRDVQAHTFHFQDIFSLFLDTAVHPTKLRQLPSSLAQTFAHLVLRYDLYYEPADDLPLTMLRMTVLDADQESSRRGQSLLGERATGAAASLDWPSDAFDPFEASLGNAHEREEAERKTDMGDDLGESGSQAERAIGNSGGASDGVDRTSGGDEPAAAAPASPLGEAMSLEDASFDSLPLEETRRTLQQRAAQLVGEVSHLLPQVTHEQSLLLLLSNLTVLHRIDLNPRASNELQAALQAFLSPGGPLFPSRQVRHAAAEVLEEVFPAGSHARRAVHLAFRLCNPCRWPLSLAQWTWQSMRGCRRRVHRYGDPLVARLPCGSRVVWWVEALERFLDWCLGQQEDPHNA